MFHVLGGNRSRYIRTYALFEGYFLEQFFLSVPHIALLILCRNVTISILLLSLIIFKWNFKWINSLCPVFLLLCLGVFFFFFFFFLQYRIKMWCAAGNHNYVSHICAKGFWIRILTMQLLGREICIKLKIDKVETKYSVRQIITVICVT